MSTVTKRRKPSTPRAAKNEVPPLLGLDDQFATVEAHWRRGLPTILVGPTGTGKTSLVQWISQQLQQTLEQVVGSRQMMLSELLGRYHLAGNGSKWIDGPLTRAVRAGRPFYFDEIGVCDESITKTLNPLTDHRRQLIVTATGEVIDAAPGFTFIASYNPGYGSNGQNLTPDLRQRFRWVAFDYLREDQEVALLVERTGVDESDATVLVAAARITRTKLRSSLPEGISMRLLLDVADDITRGMSREQAIGDAILLPLTDDAETRHSCLRTFQAEGLLSIEQLDRLGIPPRSPAPDLADDSFVELDDDEDDEDDA